MFDETLKEQSFNTYTFSNHDNKFILFLRKGIYPYEYMDHWEKFNRRSLPEKLNFYSQQNMKDIIDANCMHPKRVCKYFDRKKMRRISWFVCSKQYITVSWRISEL